MNLLKRMVISFCATFFFCVCCQTILASEVQVRLSTREAYVGSPIVLQISVVNGTNLTTPTLPEVADLKVRSAGAPAQSTKIMIVNGRHSETKSATYSFLLTPQREGQFRIPAFELDAGDQKHQVDPISFVATKSETGDLLFVEVEGGKDSVFVGESVDLSLKIWLKPFVDRNRGIKLTEGDMWNCISEGTDWGPFADRMAELASRGQRPGGEEVLRKDDEGVERSYYLYQVDAPVYPKRAGKLDLDEVQIVVDYPTGLGVSRGMMGSRLQRSGAFDLFDADFLDTFSDRLVISEKRPIVGQADVGNTEVLPIPTEGQPTDYQGAVGQYDIVVKAANTDVAVGEPISLQIDIQGTGPMDLVQAPRLEQVESLKKDFRVSTQTLAGTTMGPAKYFDTTIRPLNENVKQIPPIPFSFFDPAEQSFKTVYSKPIAIQVRPGETLALDSIVAESQPKVSALSQDRSVTFDPLKDWNWDSWKNEPNFKNPLSSQMLVSENRPAWGPVTWWFWLPPIIWFLGWTLRWRGMPGWAWNAVRSSDRKLTLALTASQASGARTGNDTAEALGQFVCEVCRARMPGEWSSSSVSVTTQAVGCLRLLGLYQLAAQIESFINRCRQSHDEVVLQQLNTEAISLAEEVKVALKSCRPKRVATRTSVTQLARQSSMLWGIFLAAGLVAVPAPLIEAKVITARDVVVQKGDDVLEEIVKEATQLYQSALDSEPAAESENIESLQLASQGRFQRAADKYQFVIDAGVQNHQLFLCAGNAYAKAGMRGRAIYCYRKGLLLRPGDAQLLANLQSVQSSVSMQPAALDSSAWNQAFGWLSPVGWNRLLLVGWVVFWGMLIVRQWGLPVGVLWPAVSLLLAGVSAFGVFSQATGPTAVVVSNQINVRESDGESFPTVAEFEKTNGWQLPVLEERGDWVQVQLSTGETGWLPQEDVLLLN